MAGAQIGPLTAKVIALIMTRNENFCKYDLSQNEIGDEGAKYIAHALLHRPSIISLNLSTNSISNSGL